MSPIANASLTLLAEAKTEGLYDKLLLQLQKDFVLANISFEFSKQPSAKVICNLLQEKIYVLILEKFQEYLNLLYIIDVPENVFKEIETTDVVAISKQVSFFIFKRELQKVRLKKKYNT